MSKLSKQKKQHIVLVILGALFVTAAIWYVVIQNQYSSLAGVHKKTIEMKEKVSKAGALLKKTGEIETTLEEETKKLNAIEGNMASGDIYLWMINTINRFNTGRGITFLDFPRETLGEVGMLSKFPYKAATFPMRGTAHYHELGKFIAEFENSFPYVRVQNLELSPSTKAAGDDAESLNFNFQIVALVKPTAQ